MVLYNPKSLENFNSQNELYNQCKKWLIKTGEEGDNILTLQKGKEIYGYRYKNEDKAEVLRHLGEFATNPQLNFSWYDAAVLSGKIRKEDQLKELEKINNRF